MIEPQIFDSCLEQKNKAFYNQNWGINEKLSCINPSGKSDVWPVSFRLWRCGQINTTYCNCNNFKNTVFKNLYPDKALSFQKSLTFNTRHPFFLFSPFFLQINFSQLSHYAFIPSDSSGGGAGGPAQTKLRPKGPKIFNCLNWKCYFLLGS